MRGIHDADGNVIQDTTNDDGGEGYNSRLTFTATESGTHYIAAGAFSSRGTYEVEVTDNSPPIVVSNPIVQRPPAFSQPGYAFDLAENADGGANRVSLGTVSATDPEGVTLAYSLVDGNDAGCQRKAEMSPFLQSRDVPFGSSQSCPPDTRPNTHWWARSALGGGSVATEAHGRPGPAPAPHPAATPVTAGLSARRQGWSGAGL